MSLVLTPDQEDAADMFLQFMLDENQSKMIIRGHAGCGKSTLTRHILKVVGQQMRLLNILVGKNGEQDLNIYVTATTNKAARVIADMVGCQPKTIHSLLGLRVVNDFKTGATKLQKTKEYQVYRNSLLIIDEASYIDPDLLQMIEESTMHCKVLFIGDPYQLAPVKVKHPPVFEMEVTTARLSTVKRNGGPIADLSGAFREAVETDQFPNILDHVNGQEILHVDGPTFQGMVDDEYRVHDEDDHAKILAWTNDRVTDYNNYVRELRGLDTGLQEGERVVTNKPILANGGVVSTDSFVTVTDAGHEEEHYGITGTRLELDGHLRVFLPHNARQVKALLKQHARDKNWGSYFEIKDQWADLRPLHACTLHKSQGSTYGKVFVDLADLGRCNIRSDVARMLYVGTSRAANQVIFYGDLPRRYQGG